MTGGRRLYWANVKRNEDKYKGRATPLFTGGRPVRLALPGVADGPSLILSEHSHYNSVRVKGVGHTTPTPENSPVLQPEGETDGLLDKLVRRAVKLDRLTLSLDRDDLS